MNLRHARTASRNSAVLGGGCTESRAPSRISNAFFATAVKMPLLTVEHATLNGRFAPEVLRSKSLRYERNQQVVGNVRLGFVYFVDRHDRRVIVAAEDARR